MGFDANVEFLRMAFWQILIISGPLLAVALAIGLTIGILQAATSIQEMTLTFVPKVDRARPGAGPCEKGRTGADTRRHLSARLCLAVEECARQAEARGHPDQGA